MWAWVRIRLLLWQSDFFIVPFLCWNYYPQGDFIASLINSPVPFAIEGDRLLSSISGKPQKFKKSLIALRKTQY
jgi:hypothetical protein